MVLEKLGDSLKDTLAKSVVLFDETPKVFGFLVLVSLVYIVAMTFDLRKQLVSSTAILC